MSSNQQIVLSNIHGYIQRILLHYSISGQFPEGWHTQDYDAYLANSRQSSYLAVYCFNDAPLKHNTRLALEDELLKRFSVCAKAYKSHIVCLILIPADASETAVKTLHQQLFSLFSSKGLRIQGDCVSLNSSISALPEIYRKLYAQAAAVPMDSQARFSMLIKLYSLEDELSDSVFRVDSDEIRRILNSITQIVTTTNADNHINVFGYYCFLWRNLERIIFRRVGRRKTSVDKLLIDEELFACHDARDMADALHRYILSYARDLQLHNHDDYHKVIERTKDYIQEKYAENLSLERVARESGISACYLSKLFKKEVGMNFKQYVIKVRMEKAKFLLSIGKLNIGEVARACGYSEASYFCRMFKQYWGVLPKEFQMHT